MGVSLPQVVRRLAFRALVVRLLVLYGAVFLMAQLVVLSLVLEPVFQLLVLVR